MQSKIVLVRKKLDKSQLEFADFLGVTQSTVSLWEKNMSIPEPAHLKKILDLAKSYGIEITAEDILNMRSNPRNRARNKPKKK
jgi:transcriptional regulator with XRE-family HTH domain